MATFKTEAEMAPPVVEWLQSLGYVVHEEVDMGMGYPRPDLIGIANGRCHLLELKRSLTFSLLAQAKYWRWRTEWTSVVVPARKTRAYENDKGRALALDLADDLGVGVLELVEHRDAWRVKQVLAPKLRRWNERMQHPRDNMNNGVWFRFGHVREKLGDHNLYRGTAGQQHAPYLTPFKLTCEELVDVVQSAPGIEFKKAIERVTHHYANDSSAKSSLASFIGGKVLPQIELRHGKLYPREVRADV